VCVYIQEAHPSDGWQVPMNETDDVVYAQPTSENARIEVASACLLDLQLEMPLVLDEMSNAVDTAYAALPERLYVVDAQGRIAYRGDPGPFGFHPDEWEKEIEKQVGAGIRSEG
jgi:hypothetical protein